MIHRVHPKVVHPKDLLKDKRNNFNTRLAKRMGNVLGSMWFFYFCILLDLFMLPTVITQFSPVLFVTYIAQTVIQLLALPVLQVYQNLMQDISGAKADADHAALTHIATVVDQILEK